MLLQVEEGNILAQLVGRGSFRLLLQVGGGHPSPAASFACTVLSAVSSGGHVAAADSLPALTGRSRGWCGAGLGLGLPLLVLLVSLLLYSLC